MISVILVNWNGSADTIACLQSLLNSKPVAARIIVVDNASDNDSIEIFHKWSKGQFEIEIKGDVVERYVVEGKDCVRQLFEINYDESKKQFTSPPPIISIASQDAPNIYLVRSSRNGGFGFGCNIGTLLAKQLGTDVIWLLNNDCVVKPETLKLVHDQVMAYPQTIFGVILKYYFYPERIQAIGGGSMSPITGNVTTFNSHSNRPPLNFINGASMAFTLKCFNEVGGFDEKIFMYFEENDFCLRAAKKGFCFDVIHSEVFHKHGGSQRKAPSDNAWTQVFINKRYVLKKNLGWGMWVIFFFTMLGLRSLLPLGPKASRQGARRALAFLIFGRAV